MAAQGKTLVEMALKHQGCTQKELAARLGVSTTQVSKWKKNPDEHMSSEMTIKLRALAGITDDFDADVIAWAGSTEDAAGWDAWFTELAEHAADDEETGYNVEFPDEYLTASTVDILNEMGIAPPRAACDDREIYKEASDYDDATYTPITETVRKIYEAYVNVYSFHAAYVTPVINDDDFGEDELYLDYTGCLLQLAACKIEIDTAIAPKFDAFKLSWTKRYRKYVKAIKLAAMKAGIPLPWELLNLVYDDHESVGHAAERESLGFNARNLHPDVYINEILGNLRLVHQVLPAIMKKLGIDEKEFRIDQQALYVSGGERRDVIDPVVDEDDDDETTDDGRRS
jgi:transcriptional regulator with XRE-family HTH domain